MRRYLEFAEEKKAEIIEILRSALQARPEIIFSYLYGSFEELRRFRDLDIAVYMDLQNAQELDVLGYQVRLASELEDAFARNVSGIKRPPVDVRVVNGAPLGFLYHVTRGIVLTSRDEEARCDFVERVWTEYLDFAPKGEEFLKEMFPPKQNEWLSSTSNA